jgi:hypothetical protein
VQNYFNYFTEVEDRFQQRRGSLLLLSTLDWALIESWRDAGIPLAAVLRGIDASFDKYESRKAKGRARKVNGLAWCAQGVMEAAEQLREAATGTVTDQPASQHNSGFEHERIARHLTECAGQLAAAHDLPTEAQPLVSQTMARLHELAQQLTPQSNHLLEDLERTLHTLESKLLSILLATAPESELVALRTQAAKEIAPFRSRMQALQLRQIEQQFLEKRILEKYAIPRLSLFYMRAEL